MPHDRTTSFFADYSFFKSHTTENDLADKVSHLLLSKNTVLKFSLVILVFDAQTQNSVTWYLDPYATIFST